MAVKTITAVEPSDAQYIAPNIRPQDLAEMQAVLGEDVNAALALATAIARSDRLCWLVFEDDTPLFVLGCAATEWPGIGSPWLIATTAARPGTLTKITKLHIPDMLRVYDMLVNYVDARNTASLDWLAHLGFQLGPPMLYGVQGRPFHRFTMGA